MDIALRGRSVDFSGSDRCTMQLGVWVGAKIGRTYMRSSVSGGQWKSLEGFKERRDVGRILGDTDDLVH